MLAVRVSEWSIGLYDDAFLAFFFNIFSGRAEMLLVWWAWGAAIWQRQENPIHLHDHLGNLGLGAVDGTDGEWPCCILMMSIVDEDGGGAVLRVKRGRDRIELHGR